MDKTILNIANAFAGESQARNRYTYFASIAKKEGYEQIAAIFLETADNEKEHAKLFYKLLDKGFYTVNAEYPFELGSTLENLKSAARGEHEEWSQLYAQSAIIAREEGYKEAANTFLQVLEAEKHHEERFLKLIQNIENDKVFKRDKKVIWKCRNCGRLVEGLKAPELCPTCKHPKDYFELFCENL